MTKKGINETDPGEGSSYSFESGQWERLQHLLNLERQRIIEGLESMIKQQEQTRESN